MTEGYDIPRACALFQIRDTDSKTLSEQVLGRIRRNPILKD
jgi:type III restriction enzyme